MNENEELEFDSPLEEEVDAIGVPSEKRKIYTELGDPEIESLHGKFKRNKLIVQPDFQRQFVWDSTKSSRLIESARERRSLGEEHCPGRQVARIGRHILKRAEKFIEPRPDALIVGISKQWFQLGQCIARSGKLAQPFTGGEQLLFDKGIECTSDALGMYARADLARRSILRPVLSHGDLLSGKPRRINIRNVVSRNRDSLLGGEQGGFADFHQSIN